MVDLNQYQETFVALDNNEAQLNKARQSVSDVTWFFNNKELSTKASGESRTPEAFSLWFAQGKERMGSICWEYRDSLSRRLISRVTLC